MQLLPELLLHPNIPKPLHGTAPRTILGDAWWNKEKPKAYAANNYCCWACGIHKSFALFHSWLEAHEIYVIDYSKGEVRFDGTCALCHACHNFIHSGRLYNMYLSGKISKKRITTILNHGFKVLTKVDLPLNLFAVSVADQLHIALPSDNIQADSIMGKVAWSDWYMLIDGKKYEGQFTDYQAWLNYYS